jgi:hypothetical protein
MIEELTSDLTAEMERKAKWDRFLDAYSQYLKERSLANAAMLRLAGNELETADERFSMKDFQEQLGWDVEVEC